MTPHPRQSGIALVTAVLVMALATIAATAILVSANVAVHRAGNLQDSEKAWWYASGVESWVKSVLERDLEDNKTDSMKDVWARPDNYFPVDQGFIRGGVVDLQGRFNVNNLAVPEAEKYKRYAEQFERLLAGLDVEGVDGFQARAIVSAIRDWVDADAEPTGFDGAEDTEYLQADGQARLPQRVPNRPMESITELLAIKGMTRPLYLKLQEHVAALPQYDTPVNVNTATEPVLRALVRNPSPEFEKFVRDRLEKPAESESELTLVFPAADMPPGARLIDVKSHYFQMRAEAQIGSGRVALYSVIFRPGQGAPVVLGHSVDTD